MSKKKILHVSYGGIGNGGVGSVLISIVQSLHTFYNFGIISFPICNSREHIVRQYSKIHYINCYGKSGWRKILEILIRPFVIYFNTKKICKEDGYDVIHCHNGADMVFCLLAAKHAGIKKRIAHSHNSLSPKRSSWFVRVIRDIQYYYVNKLATHRVGCSSLACEAMFKGYDSKVIFNSIDLSRFPWQRNKHEGLRIVHVGRYEYQKNQSFIIDIINILKDKIPDLHLSLIGFGYDEDMLRQKVENLHLQGFIEFKDGKNVDIHAAFANADIMIFPSEYEGFGIVLIEAQATGCYCFASDVVPKDTNVGMIDFLGLNLGADIWADRIIKYWDSIPNHFYEKIESVLTNYDNKVISDQYYKLYEE